MSINGEWETNLTATVLTLNIYIRCWLTKCFKQKYKNTMSGVGGLAQQP